MVLQYGRVRGKKGIPIWAWPQHFTAMCTHSLLFPRMVNSNSRFPLLSFIAFLSLCWLHSWLLWASDESGSTECKELPDSDDVENDLRADADKADADKANDATPKRRALLVGICYEYSPCDESTALWEILEGTHTDVECFRDLLISAYSLQHLAGLTSPGIDPYPSNQRILTRRHHHP
jgi:hypothetical protein